ncbi:hypothetical protein SBA4_930017 [Candidatus Sulfopaludibacter sp. SbA4]|nr:hypothetical protein SBA4_930017 [Candidatus Sulfopaludibacter sp. SbA4]
MVVDRFNVKGVSSFKAEDNAERVKAIPWNIQSFGRGRAIENREDSFKPCPTSPGVFPPRSPRS